MTTYEAGTAESTPRRFDIGDAAFQVFKHAGREGPGGLAAFGAVVVALQLLLGLILVWGFFPLFEWGALQDGEGPPASAPPFGRVSLSYVIYVVGLLVLYAAVDAGLLRWLYGGGRPRLGLGADTWRLVGVAICWLFLSIGVFGPGVALMIAGAGTESALLGLLGGLALLGGVGAWIWLAVRLAPAAALTVYRGRLHFAAAWRVSGAAAWPMTGAYVIVWAIYFGASMVVQGASYPMMLAVMFAPDSPLATAPGDTPPEPEAVMAFLTSPGVLAVYAVLSALSFVVAFLFQSMLAGVNAYGVRHAEGGG